MDKEEPSLPSKKPSSFYWACVKDAFGKAWWLVGVVTIILPLLKGLVDENEQGWQNWKVVKFLHDYGDFDIPILLGLAICAWRLLKAPYDIFAREREAANKLAKKLHEIEIERITLLLEFAPDERTDFELHVRTHKLRVTNLHSSKTALGVCVYLEKIESEAWKQGIPPEIVKTKFPLALPVSPAQYNSGEAYEYKCDINPGNHADFDLAYSRIEMGVRWFVGLPPFLRRQVKGDLSKSDRDFAFGTTLAAQQPLAFFVYLSAVDVPKLYSDGALNFTFGDVQASHAFMLGKSVAHQQNYTHFSSKD